MYSEVLLDIMRVWGPEACNLVAPRHVMVGQVFPDLFLKSIQKWRQQGNPNVKHIDYLLSAESADLKKDCKSAETFYKKAVISAGRTGHLHHAALSCEKYADFLMRITSKDKESLDYRREDSAYYRKEAIRFYKAWGALKKVEILER